MKLVFERDGDWMATLIPAGGESNPFMYCNYTKEHRHENPCKSCSNNCKHKGEETSY